MNRARDASDEEEATVKAMLRRAGGAAPIAADERRRVRDAMMGALAAPSPSAEWPEHAENVPEFVIDLDGGDEMRSTTSSNMGEGSAGRLVLWAAVVLLVAATVGLLSMIGRSDEGPAGPVDGSRMRVEVGDVEVGFDALNGYVAMGDPDGIVSLAQSANSRGHFNVRVVQVELFDGEPVEARLEALGLRPELGVANAGAVAWFVFPGAAPDCVLRSPCETLATLPNGEVLQLTAGTLTRIEIHDVNGDDPIVVVSEAGSRGNGPALLDVSISG